MPNMREYAEQMFNDLMNILQESGILQKTLFAIIALMLFAMFSKDSSNVSESQSINELSRQNQDRIESLKKQNRTYESQIRAFQEQHEQAARNADWDSQEHSDIDRSLKKLFGHIQTWSCDYFDGLKSSEHLRDFDFVEELRKVSWNTDTLIKDNVGVDFLMEAITSHLLGKSILQDAVQWCDDNFQTWFNTLYSHLKRENKPVPQEWARTTLNSYLGIQTQPNSPDIPAPKDVHTIFIREISRSLQSIVRIVGRYCKLDEIEAMEASEVFIKLAAQDSVELYRRSGLFQLYDMAAIGDTRDVTESLDDFDFRPMYPEECWGFVPNLVLQPGILWGEDLDASKIYKKPSVQCCGRQKVLMVSGDDHVPSVGKGSFKDSA